jgi:hypothetical protein
MEESEKILLFKGLPYGRMMKALRLEMGLTIEEVNPMIDGGYCKVTETKEYDPIVIAALGGSPHIASLEKFFGIEFIERYDNEIHVTQEQYSLMCTPLAARIKQRIRALSTTIDNIADDCGFDIESVKSWVSGERVPNERCFALLDGALTLGKDVIKK